MCLKKVIGFGTGRCGTTSLANLLNVQSDNERPKSLHLKWGEIVSYEQIKLLEKVGGIGYQFLFSIPKLINIGFKIIYIERNSYDTSMSWLRYSNKLKRDYWRKEFEKEQKQYLNYYFENFPTYEGCTTKIEAINLYVRDYKSQANKLLKEYPEILHIKVNDLNDLSKVTEIINFSGLNVQPRILKSNIG